ncbi:MAG: chloramphenicol acetyltransferase [Desulfovibrio sp.]|nr:chloramphenicol acetyltransferase [Desulfovibrio sp.]
MKYIDIDSWDRKEHFNFFQASVNPCLGITVPVDVAALAEFRKSLSEKRPRFTDCVYYAVVKSINAEPEFRMRLVDRRPVEFDRIHAGFTYVARGRRLHSNCVARFDESFSRFSQAIQAARDAADLAPTLAPAGGESQALVYMTCMPGVAFTAFTNPWGDPWTDTVPRIAFGKADPDTHKMPVSIEVLHSFIDGTHIEAFLGCLQGILDEPEAAFTS